MAPVARRDLGLTWHAAGREGAGIDDAEGAGKAARHAALLPHQGAHRAVQSRCRRPAEVDRMSPEHDAPLPGGPLDSAFAAGRRQRLRPGARLFEEGDVSNKVVLLLAGRVKVSTLSEDGRETVLGFRGSGDVLGELAAVDEEPHLATVTVVEAGEALVVTHDRFRAALREDPDLALALLRLVVSRLRDADHKRAEFLALDVVGRVAQRLTEMAEGYGRASPGGIRIELSMSQRELAGWVGASREAANKALAQLEHAGLITTVDRRIVVLDLEGLRARAV
jgi:CRP/FNR family transcriptional regulator, cyclic AMP receptor protein